MSAYFAAAPLLDVERVAGVARAHARRRAADHGSPAADEPRDADARASPAFCVAQGFVLCINANVAQIMYSNYNHSPQTHACAPTRRRQRPAV